LAQILAQKSFPIFKIMSGQYHPVTVPVIIFLAVTESVAYNKQHECPENFIFKSIV